MAKSQKQFYFYTPEGLSLVKHSGAGASALLRAAGRAFVQCDDGQAALYATDIQGSVLRCIGRNSSSLMHYMVYGWDSQTAAAPVLRFSSQRKGTLTGHYLLGDGYRAFIPTLMRFNAPDSLSPFAQGGLNTYSYCGGDPVNRNDSTGHSWWSWLRPRVPRSAHPGTTQPASLAPSVSTKSQAQFNQQMNERLKQHNATVSANIFESGLAYQGRNTNVRVQRISEASSWSFTDHGVVEAAAVSLTRDYQSRSQSPEFRSLFEKTVGLEKKIRSVLPDNAKSEPNVKWQLDENNQHIRVAG
ncbi:RHS repeat-associated core domain-containing protein [Pseudomonas sp. TWI929]|uniref:RHS repeat-associated core domain-containing protein n=1 Tax=Pseudomonas sp. TWI929 TaxID=3136795 RepID=UPI00320ACB63